MDNTKNDLYYLEKIKSDLSFIVEHMKSIDIQELNENEILLDSMLFRMIQISENAKKLTEDYKGSKKVTITVDAGIHKKLKIIASSQEISLPMVIEPMLEEKVNEIDIVKLVEESLS